MSTQLILYPQTYRGYSSTGSVYSFLVDGISFTSINTSSSVTNSGTYVDILTAQPPNIVNTWYRSREDAAIAYPTQTSSNLVFTSVSAGQYSSSVYQRLANLTVGQVYTVTVNMVSNTSGSGAILMVNGTTLAGIPGGFILFGYNINQATVNFTAQTTTDILFLSWHDNVDNTMIFSDISVTTAVLNPTQVFTDLQDGQVICDLYQEEDIPLTLSIDDFKNVAEQIKSYSKDFDLPATKRNNRIFNNMFEITRADDHLIFNPYVRTKCVLKQDGFILFEGYLRMIDIKDKEGEISYNVNLYSEVITLADILKDAKFSDLDFTELTHDYNKTQIKRSWNESPATSITYLNAGTSGFRETYDTLRYPFIDWTHQSIISQNTGATGPTFGNPQLPSLETAFRPCIQLKYLINRIFAASGFNYTSDFFDSADFEKLYMDFNWGADNTPLYIGGNTFYAIYLNPPAGALPTGNNYATTTYSNLWLSYDVPFLGSAVAAPPNYSTSTFRITSTIANENYNISYDYKIKNNDTVARDIECQWLYNNTPINYSGVQTIAADSTYNYTGNFVQVMQVVGDTLQVQFKTDVGTADKVQQVELTSFLGTATSFIVGIGAVTTNIFLQTLRGELGQWDFLKGIMTMFNLVSLVDENDPDNILIEPYNDIFITNPNSTRLDWTDKVDVSQMELKPLTDLNKNTIFKFVEDDDDYAFNVFKQAQSGHLYGSLEYSAEGFTILEGTKEIIAEPFAATVSKPIDDQFSSFIVPSIYALNEDGTSEGFDNSPRIFYNNGIKSTGASYYIPPQNGGTSSNTTDFLQFSHLSDIPTVVSSPPAVTDTRDFVFTSAQLVTSLGDPPIDNLFQTYWSPYFNELYNADTRTMTLKVNLSPSDVASFKFYDTVFIKNRSFRVNKIEYKPNSLAKVEFILIP
jgi:hypothetical protein